MSTLLPVIGIALAALLLAALGGWPVTQAVLRASRAPARERPVDPSGVPLLEAPTDHERDDDPAASGDELLRGGLWIGLLERACIALCVLAHHPELIAVVIALKGLGRYPELRERTGAAERFLVGSFASVLWASLIGIAGLGVISAMR